MEVEVACRCGARFGAPASLRGGLANCPKCGKATPVGGGPEPVFWGLVGIGILLVLGLAAIVGAVGGLAAGGIALGVGTAILTAVILAS